MVTTTTTATILSDTNTFIDQVATDNKKTPLPASFAGQQQQQQQPSRQDIINNLIQLAKQEQAKGNTSITSDKLDKLQSVLNNKPEPPQRNYNFDKFHRFKQVPEQDKPRSKPQYPPFFDKFDIDKAEPKKGSSSSSSSSSQVQDKDSSTSTKKRSSKYKGKFFKAKKFTFKQLEFMFINFLETIANILDNLHLLSNLPMFPQVLTKLLKQTNKLWVLILVFLVRKTISQLLNVIRKIRKVHTELNIMNEKTTTSKPINEDINKKYNKILKDLKFDKMMLIFELVGNFLDLTFNLIELSQISVPNWLMSALNVASMGMTIYRMNKDDEYIDDDITEDLI
ncbi:hypothetical protein CANMA_000254 [Candida margitis]|uniref:uncharacterized protein n=1 Tax=Candida margitis TaxID=1775924 RepID=UPI002227B487|nr:uncharacterized protein CANMA_000254 [Candida margitis]KAI5970663.1 hypothetical protein CANMA_000254 [Candida margitis]